MEVSNECTVIIKMSKREALLLRSMLQSPLCSDYEEPEEEEAVRKTLWRKLHEQGYD